MSKFDQILKEAKKNDDEAPETGEEDAGEESGIKLSDVKAFLKSASKSDLEACAKEIEKLLVGDEETGEEDAGEEDEKLEEGAESAFDRVCAKYGITVQRK